jgi:precorrin-2 methylase
MDKIISTVRACWLRLKCRLAMYEHRWLLICREREEERQRQRQRKIDAALALIAAESEAAIMHFREVATRAAWEAHALAHGDCDLPPTITVQAGKNRFQIPR